MLMAIACAVVGFVAGVLFAMHFPLGLYWQRLLFRLRQASPEQSSGFARASGPSRFEIDGKEYLLGPDDTLHWDIAGTRPREED